FDRDLSWRTGVQLFPIICESSNNFKVTKKALEDAYNKAQESNITIKGLLLNNPSNPLGTILDMETLKDTIRFINDKNIHLVCDEIYAATVFNEPKFISISEVIISENVQCNLDLIHIVYSLSKDLGFPGFRVGIIYSYNDVVTKCARKMSSFGLVSTQTQYLISNMLLDDTFIEKFVVESQNTFESEIELWRMIINDVKLNVSPGCSFHCCEPGWFRVCFASMDDDTMRIALRRIEIFVVQYKGINNIIEEGIENSLPIAPGPVSLTSISNSNEEGEAR
ncbi:hypothetical protein MTR67_050712, partial [Solanum verrucosum]